MSKIQNTMMHANNLSGALHFYWSESCLKLLWQFSKSRVSILIPLIKVCCFNRNPKALHQRGNLNSEHLVNANTFFNWVFILINLISVMVTLSTLDHLWRHCWPNLFHWIVSVSRCEKRHVKYINSFEPWEQSALMCSNCINIQQKTKEKSFGLLRDPRERLFPLCMQ